MTASKTNNASLRLALMGTTAVLVLALAPHGAHAQTAYDATFSGSGVAGTAVVTTNGTTSNGNVADSIAGSLTDTVNGAGTITGLSQTFASPDNNIQATSPNVDFNGLSFNASNGASYNIFSDVGVYGIVTPQTGFFPPAASVSVTVHASIDTAQASYDETSAPLTQSTVVFEGGTFTPTGPTSVTAPVILSSYNGGGTVNTANGDVYFDSAITGPGGLTVTGTSNNRGVILQTANSYTGGTTVTSAGILAVTVAGSLPGDVTNDGYVQFFDPTGSVYGGVISGSGGVQAFNPGGSTLILSGNNTSSGTLFIYSGVVQLGNGGSSGAWAGGIGDGASLVFNNTGSTTYGGSISDFNGGVGTVTVQSGTVTFTGASTYTGATTINAGATLALSGAGSIANSGDPLVNGAFDISGTTSGASVVSLSGSGVVTLGAKTLTLTGATDTFSGAINNVGGAVVAIGGGVTIAGGTETLTGDNLYNGATIINSGATLALSGNGAIGVSSGVTANGTFDVSQSTSPSLSINSLSGSGSVALGGQSLVLANASGTFSGVIADGGLGGGTGGTLTIGSGTEILTGTNTYTGDTLIDGSATLQLGNGGAGGTVAGSITDQGVLKFDYSGAVTVGSHISGNGSVEIVAGTVVVTTESSVGGTVTVDSGATLQWGNGVFPSFLVGTGGAGLVDNGAIVMDFGIANNLDVGPISGSGSVTIHSGKDTNFATDTYTGATTIDAGAILAMSTSGSIATSSGVTANGTFDISQTNAGTEITSLSGAGAVKLGGFNLVLTNASETFSGVIADGGIGGGAGGGLEIAGGTETLSGANTYTGATTIDAGATLALSGVGSIASSGDPLVNGTFDISQTTAGASVVSLSGSGSVLLGGQILTLTGAADTFSGVIADGGLGGGTGGELKIAAGTETLTGANTYTGLTLVSAGATLQLGDGGAAGSVAGSIVDNGLVQFNHSGSSTLTGGISGGGSAEVVAGTEVVTDTYSLGGTVTIDSGATLAWGDGTTSAYLVGAGNAVVDNGSLVIDYGAFSAGLDVPISGSGSVTIHSGRLLNGGISTYTGSTTIDPNAIFSLTGAGSIAQSSGVTANGYFDISGANAGVSIVSLDGSGGVGLGARTLTLTNASGTFSGAIDDNGGAGGGLTVAGGTETLAGDNSYTGATTVGAGATLALSGSGTISLSSGVIANGTFDVSQANEPVFINSLSGAGAVALGGQTLVLTNASGTFSGVIADGGIGGGTGGGLEVGGGTETLTGVNTFTGAAVIDTGATLALSGSGSIASAAGVSDSGTFDISGTTTGASIVSLSGSGAVALGGKTLTLTGAGDTFSGVIADGGVAGGTGGTLIIAGGTETLTGTNTYTGPTVINSGATLQLGDGGTTGTVASQITDNGTLLFDYSGTVTRAAGVFGGGSVEVVAGDVIMAATGDVAGTVTVDAGATLEWGNGAAQGFLMGDTTTADNGTIIVNLGAGHGFGTIDTISGTGDLIIESGQFGTGGVNTLSGTLTVDAGATLTVGGTASFADAHPVVDGTLDISLESGGVSLIELAGAGTGLVNLGGKTLTLTNAGNTTFAGVIQGSGGLTIAGGTETLTGVNTFTGITTVNAGATLALAGGGSIADSGDPLVNGTFDISQTTSGASIVSLSGSGSVRLGSKALTLTSATDTFSGVISDGGLGGGTGGSLAVAGGVETLTGANTYTGGTTVDIAAGLVVGDGATHGSIVGDVVADGNFYFNRSDTIIFAGSISGTGAIVQNGGGTTILTADSPFSGGTYIYGGPLQLGNGGATGSLANSLLIFDSSLLIFDRSAATTYGGVIEDGFNPGGVTEAGTGAVTLTGDNTFTGTLTINAGGQVNLGAGGTTGSVVGPIDDNGLLTFNHSNAITYAGAITGSGAVTQVGSGTLTLTGTNTYAGLTTINAGTSLQLGAATTTGTVAGDILDNGALTVDLDNNWVYGGVISGSETLTQAGSWSFGSLILTGTSTYAGGTTINSATSLVLGNDTATGSIVGNVVDNGQLVFDRSNAYTFAGVISGAGAVYSLAPGVITLTGTNTYAGGTIIAAGATIQIGNGTTVGSIVGNVGDAGTLIYDHSDTVTPVGVISGTGALTQAGTGLLVLNGVNTVSGLTTVSAGTLEVGDATHTGAVLDSHIGGVTVGAAGTLEGHGTINGAVRNLAGGTVRPGGSIGTLTVGSYSQGPASTLAIEVSPPAASLLNSLGSASLNGTLALTFDPGPYSAHIYEIVAGAPVSGTFSTVTQSGLPSSIIYGVYYAPSHTQVDLVTEPITAGQGFAAINTASLDQAQAFAGMVTDRQDDAGCSTEAKDQRAAGKSAACDGPSVWAQALGAASHTNGAGDLVSANTTSGGFIGGVDARFGGGGSVGLALGWADNTLNMDTATTKSTGYAVFASLYGREAFGGFVFDAQGFYMDSRWTQTRTIAGYGNATSHPNGTTGGGVIQVSYPLVGGMVKPYLKVSYADFDREATVETGAAVGPLALAAASGSNASTRAEAGVRFATTTTEEGGVTVSPELRLGVSQDLSSNTRNAQVALALVPTTTFTTYSVKPDQTAGVVAGAVRVKLSDTLDFYGDLRGRFSENQSEGSVTVGGRYRF